jgi:hypothetical protein
MGWKPGIRMSLTLVVVPRSVRYYVFTPIEAKLPSLAPASLVSRNICYSHCTSRWQVDRIDANLPCRCWDDSIDTMAADQGGHFGKHRFAGQRWTEDDQRDEKTRPSAERQHDEEISAPAILGSLRRLCPRCLFLHSPMDIRLILPGSPRSPLR